MSESRTKRNLQKVLRIVLSSLFHLGFLGAFVVAFVVSLDEDLMFELALDAIKITEDVPDYLMVIIVLYLFVIFMHFAEIIVELRQTRRVNALNAEVTKLKAKIYELTQEEEAREEKMQAFKDSLDDQNG